MRFLSALAASLALALAFTGVGPARATPDAATPAATAAPDFSWVDKLPRQTGAVALATAQARLNLGDDYYFLGPAEAKRVLTELWGNPPEATDGVLGMIFPKKYGPGDDGAWGGVITYEDVGYVSDADAAKIDAPKLLDQLREGESEGNEARKKAGYDQLHLVGWAEPPSYDPATHSAVWARELERIGKPDHTLNYGIRILGRKGVLSLNIVAPMTSLAEVRGVSTQVRSLAAYDPGSRYADVDQKNDKMAAYGVAGLIAAGVGVAAVKKVGLLGLLLVFGKKAFLLIAAAAAGIGARFRSFFGNLFGKKTVATPPPSSSGGGPDIVQ
jgi:uncharacterized membrane-anchored protein